MSDERFTELEIKLAYQEDLVKGLNDVICRHQNSIDRLEQTCSLLLQRLQAVAESSEPVTFVDNERPPHY